MQVRMTLDGLDIQIVPKVRTVVVMDDHGNPLYIGQQLNESTCIHEKAGAQGFQKLVEATGVKLKSAYKVSAFKP